MGNAHARHYRNMADVDLTFYDLLPDRSSAFASRHNCEPCASAEDLISRCDVVDVCLPTDAHLEYGLKAIAAGRAVFMEKPITRTLEEAEKLLQAASKAAVPLMPGQVVRFFPEYSAARKRVISGAIGKPAAARTRRGGGPPLGGADNWFMDFARSGGVLVDLAIHDFDWLRWTFGEVKSLYARSVAAATGTGPDYGLATLTFDSGLIAHVEATWMDPSGFRTAFEVCGSEGMIEFDSRTSPPLRLLQAGKSAAESPLAPADDPYYLELRGFLDAVHDGAEPPVSGVDGLLSLGIALAALESAKTGNVVAPARG